MLMSGALPGGAPAAQRPPFPTPFRMTPNTHGGGTANPTQAHQSTQSQGAIVNNTAPRMGGDRNRVSFQDQQEPANEGGTADKESQQ